MKGKSMIVNEKVYAVVWVAGVGVLLVLLL